MGKLFSEIINIINHKINFFLDIVKLTSCDHVCTCIKQAKKYNFIRRTFKSFLLKSKGLDIVKQNNTLYRHLIWNTPLSKYYLMCLGYFSSILNLKGEKILVRISNSLTLLFITLKKNVFPAMWSVVECCPMNQEVEVWLEVRAHIGFRALSPIGSV